MQVVNILRAKFTLSRLVRAVEQGLERELIIARHGLPVAKLVRWEKTWTGTRIGVAKGSFEVPDPVETHSKEIAELFVGAPLSAIPFDTADDTSPARSECLSDNLPLLSPPLTAVSVHAGAYQAHDLLSAMPLVCTGTRMGVLGETLWERTARALQNVQPAGPYPQSDALTVFVRDNCVLTARFDVSLTLRGAIAWIVVGDVPRFKIAPIPVNDCDDAVVVARKIFAAGLPQQSLACSGAVVSSEPADSATPSNRPRCSSRTRG
ncbi:hypothetical protein PQR02_27000 [Paraburkholderia sediminicola]|uniref:Uncharacterized protein n=1 Tax=Paraburkholderia rhynchosiae TaxID=487049 RepID=A0ACC7NI84_9BURK